jgi:hypothetical protein
VQCPFPGTVVKLPLAEPVAKVGLLIAMRLVVPPVAAVPDIEALPIPGSLVLL